MEEFEHILIKYGCSRKDNKSKSLIDEIENIIKFQLPADYRIFLENYLRFENFVGNEYLRLWDSEEVIELNKNYSIVENLPNTLGIGSNGGGEFIAIVKNNENDYKIVLSPFIDLNGTNNIEIGTSFADLLVRLDKGQTWFKEEI